MDIFLLNIQPIINKCSSFAFASLLYVSECMLLMKNMRGNAVFFSN